MEYVKKQLENKVAAPMPEDMLNNIANGVPFGRMGAPKEIAHGTFLGIR